MNSVKVKTDLFRSILAIPIWPRAFPLPSAIATIVLGCSIPKETVDALLADWGVCACLKNEDSPLNAKEYNYWLKSHWKNYESHLWAEFNFDDGVLTELRGVFASKLKTKLSDALN